MNIYNLLQDLFQYSKEKEWFEYKTNWFQPVVLGEYVFALSNSAALVGKKYGYFIWGVDDSTYEIIGTNFDQYQDYKSEPYQNYLNRNLSPKIKFDFYEEYIDNKKIVVLVIEAANDVPTSFNGERFIRIGSSKASMKDNPRNGISYNYEYNISISRFNF